MFDEGAFPSPGLTEQGQDMQRSFLVCEPVSHFGRDLESFSAVEGNKWYRPRRPTAEDIVLTQIRWHAPTVMGMRRTGGKVFDVI
eukprot:768368-Hanusia_phi.AAC.4